VAEEWEEVGAEEEEEVAAVDMEWTAEVEIEVAAVAEEAVVDLVEVAVDPQEEMVAHQLHLAEKEIGLVLTLDVEIRILRGEPSATVAEYQDRMMMVLEEAAVVEAVEGLGAVVEVEDEAAEGLETIPIQVETEGVEVGGAAVAEAATVEEASVEVEVEIAAVEADSEDVAVAIEEVAEADLCVAME